MRHGSILILALVLGCTSCASRAYWGEGENTAIRGYPTVSPPPGYTGVWVSRKHNGHKLAEVSYWNGQTHGTSFWYRDDGKPYLIRQYEHGKFVKDYLVEPMPKEASRIPFWYPARYLNQSVASWNRNRLDAESSRARNDDPTLPVKNPMLPDVGRQQ